MINYVPPQPGDPRFTTYLKWVELMAANLTRPTTVWVTSSTWGHIVAEIEANQDTLLADPTKPLPRNPGCGLRFGNLNALTLVNAGTDSQLEVNRRNWDTADYEFTARLKKLRTG